MTKQYKLEAINNICHKVAKVIAEASEVESEGKGEEDEVYEKIFNSIKETLEIFTPSSIKRINKNLDTFLCN